jgi:hypothetical protein
VLHHRARPALAAAVLTLAAAAGAGLGTAGAARAAATAGGHPSDGAASAGTASAGTASAGTASAGTAVRSLFLVDGDQLSTESSAGSQCVTFVSEVPRAAAAARLQTVRVGGTTYAFPAAALPYLGRGLDPSLFDVTALASAESGGRLPVTVHYAEKLPALPGVTITSSAPGTAHGYLTQPGAARFGAALARQFAAGPAVHSGLFGGGVAVTLAGTASQPAPRHPASATDTVTLTGTGITGQPANNHDVAFLFNADNSASFDNPQTSAETFAHGVAKFSVPPGNYWAVGDFYQDLPKVKSYDEYLDVLPQFAVGANTTVPVAASAASSEVQAVLPRHAVAQDTSFQLIRSAAAGPSVSLGWSMGDGGPKSPDPGLYVSPTSGSPTVGKLATDTNYQLGSQAYPAYSRYIYNLAYQSTGTIPSQQHVVNQATLATVHPRYYSDIGSWGLLAVLPQFNEACPFGAALFWGMHYPLAPTEYVSTGPGLSWLTDYIQTGFTDDTSGGQVSSPVILAPGEQQTQDFGAYPLHPAPNVRVDNAAGSAPVQVSAGLAGNTLRLAMTAFSDSVPGHTGQGVFLPLKAQARYEIDQNGTKIAGGSLPEFNGSVAAATTLSPSPSVIRFSLNTSDSAKLGPLSSASHTVWTWRSTAGSGVTLPAGWTCLPGGVTNRSCAVQPMMTLRYGVVGLGLNGSANPGQQVVHVQVGHLQLARAAQVTGAKVAVSFNGGKTWQAATVTGTGGNYAAVFNAPAGALVTLRTSATDAAGGSVTETITNAYQA